MKKFYSIFLFIIIASCFLSPIIAPYSYDEQNLSLGMSPPSLEHFFGTDELGRDLFSRVLYGGALSFSIAIAASLLSAIIGVWYGLFSGLAGKKIDAFMMRLLDIFYCIPFTIFVIILMTCFGRNIIFLFVALAAVEWFNMAKIVRAKTLEIKSKQFVLASKTFGQSNLKIAIIHIFPNLKETILVCLCLTIPQVMLLEAFLSFLGLGVQPPFPSWGTLIDYGASNMQYAPYLLAFPAVLFSLSLLSINSLANNYKKI